MFVICSTFALAGWGSFPTPAFAAPPASAGAGVGRAQRHAHAWPHPATRAAIIRKIGRATWRKALRVATCETGLTVNWHLDGTYRGALGMYRTTFQYGQRATRYAGTTLPEQVGIAVAAFPITGGWSGWGCGGA